jgi:hypothetical protein
MSAPLAEPWLRGPLAAVHPITVPFLHSMIQVREDLARWTADLTTDQIWARPFDLGPVGFHIRHIGGASQRLATYLKGETLNEAQLLELKHEMDPGEPVGVLLWILEDRLLYAESIVKALDPRTWSDPRKVGRQALPTTVGGLVAHMAEHAQRHVGEAIVTAKVVRAAV